MKAAACLLLLAGLAQSQAPIAEERRNWFDDPFFQASSGLEGCPVPLGPLLTQDEQRREAHYRAECGTSCWLSGQCRESNAYRYDKDLAPRVAAAMKAVPGIGRSSVWVTIQRRWVFLEGCVASREQIALIEDAVRAVPEVEIVVPALNLGVAGPPRYPVAPR
jgi:hypothetical protein